jgi:hypothetical protein
MNALIQLKKATPIFLVAFACFALSPQARAICQEGCDLNRDNTFLGDDALSNNTTGISNTAIGESALTSNTSGGDNTATGSSALEANTNGQGNTATGAIALEQNRSGDQNTATGFDALFSNTTGSFNTATGAQTLVANIGGSFNTATGYQALRSNNGFFNTAYGSEALFHNSTAFSNTAMGFRALFSNQTGGFNTANGVQALYRTTGRLNIALGYQAGMNLTTGENNIDIGNAGVAGESNKIRIGIQGTHNGTFIAGIRGQPAAGGIPVIVNANGKLGTTVSSARFKEAIKPMDKASEAIHALRPVTFCYKKEIDAERIPQFGLVAEDVGKINPDLVVRDKEGKPYSVRYDAVNAMLLNEFLKEHRTVQEQGATIAEQQKEIKALKAELRELASQIQKVSAQLEVRRPAPQVAENNL